MWKTVHVYTDEETGVIVEKQHRERNGRGNESRYLVQLTKEKYMYVRRNELFKLADALGDICDKIEEGSI